MFAFFADQDKKTAESSGIARTRFWRMTCSDRHTIQTQILIYSFGSRSLGQSTGLIVVKPLLGNLGVGTRKEPDTILA